MNHVEVCAQLIKENEELKEENKTLKEKNKNLNKEDCVSVCVDLLSENKNLKEANKRLDEMVGELKVDCRKNVPWELHNIQVDKLKEENKTLKEDLEDMRILTEAVNLKINLLKEDLEDMRSCARQILRKPLCYETAEPSGA